MLRVPAAAAAAAANEPAKDSAATAAATLVNVAVGAGILSMPYSFSLMGWSLGLFFTRECRIKQPRFMDPLGTHACPCMAMQNHTCSLVRIAPATIPTTDGLPLHSTPTVAVAAVETATLCVLCAYAEESAATSYSGLVRWLPLCLPSSVSMAGAIGGSSNVKLPALGRCSSPAACSALTTCAPDWATTPSPQSQLATSPPTAPPAGPCKAGSWGRRCAGTCALCLPPAVLHSLSHDRGRLPVPAAGQRGRP